MVKSRACDGSKEAAWRKRLRQQAGSGQSVRAWRQMHLVCGFDRLLHGREAPPKERTRGGNK